VSPLPVKQADSCTPRLVIVVEGLGRTWPSNRSTTSQPRKHAGEGGRLDVPQLRILGEIPVVANVPGEDGQIVCLLEDGLLKPDECSVSFPVE